MIDRTILMLVTGCGALAGLVAFELHSKADYAQSDEAAVATAAVPPVKHTAADPTELVAAILAAPLFTESRRPPEKAATPTGSPEEPDLRLSGIIIGPDRRMALFSVPGGKALTRSEGEEVNGWRLDTISQMAVSLSGPDGMRLIEPRPGRDLVQPPRPALGRRTETVADAAPEPISSLQGGGAPGFLAPLSPLRPLGTAAARSWHP